MRHLRLALVGCGAIAVRHLDWLAAERQAEVAVFCDSGAQRAATLRNKYNPRGAVEVDLAAALRRDGLDGVLICSPTLLHYEQVCQALEAGLHVLAEKPLATRREEIVDLIDRSRRAGRILSIAHQRRYKQAFATARHELTARADWYGPIREVHIFGCERWQQTIAGTWRDDPAMGAGFFGDAGIHHVDAVFFITGRAARRVWAVSDQRGSNVEIVTRIAAELEGGIGLQAHFIGDAHHWREDVHFHCSQADLMIRNEWLGQERLLRGKDNQVQEVAELLEPDNPPRAFLRAIRENSATVSPPEIALPIFDYTTAVLRSLREGGWVDVGPD